MVLGLETIVERFEDWAEAGVGEDLGCLHRPVSVEITLELRTHEWKYSRVSPSSQAD
ncbi:MAG: hypothetical protein QM820_34360 [Minicystis sp.]